MTPAEFLPGLHTDFPADEYHRLEAMSASGAKKMLQSPAHYRLARDTPSEPTEAMRIGTAVHTLLLEPHREAELVEMPSFNRRTKDGKAQAEEWLAANAGRQAFDAETMDRIRSAAEAVRRHAGAAELLSDGRPEVSALWSDGKYRVPCKSRFDWLRSDGAIVDLKTTKDASPKGFGKTVATFDYGLQAYWYWCAHEAVTNSSPPYFAFVVVETDPPFGVACYVVPPNVLRSAAPRMETALKRYREAIDAGFWSGYEQEILPLEVPTWYVRENS